MVGCAKSIERMEGQDKVKQYLKVKDHLYFEGEMQVQGMRKIHVQ